ncbi:hypothetical protein OE766_18020 [Pararhizobium sp. YC-54]|uniref:hypothetical protein n=1 Tax=Pararhizobium sp. YC-54 TaxID=2986920 RepID=UPI0021F72526|nr:hypothetical protein [Pararhizobium sp. YC-54]MCW0000134.1 hypothetical protein [Pararhizobium sp. YC-54]
MQSKKTHEQQIKIIEKREKTANAGADFDAAADLKKAPTARTAAVGGRNLKQGAAVQNEDRSIVRGRNQESQHKKR